MCVGVRVCLCLTRTQWLSDWVEKRAPTAAWSQEQQQSVAGEGGEKLKCHPAVGCRREKQEDKREKHTDGGGKKYSQEGERAQGRRRAKGHGSKSGGRWKDPATPHPCSPSHSPVTTPGSPRRYWQASESATKTSGDTSETRSPPWSTPPGVPSSNVRRLRCPHFTSESRWRHGNLSEWAGGGRKNANRAAEVLGGVLLHFRSWSLSFDWLIGWLEWTHSSAAKFGWYRFQHLNTSWLYNGFGKYSGSIEFFTLSQVLKSINLSFPCSRSQYWSIEMFCRFATK